MNKILILLVTVMCSCGQREEIITHTSYSISSVRVDDDREYHIIGRNNDNNSAIAWNDMDNGFGINVYYRDIEKPYALETIRNNVSDNITLYLPINYKIETFND